MGIQDIWSQAWWIFGFGFGFLSGIIVSFALDGVLSAWISICDGSSKQKPSILGILYQIMVSIIYLLFVGWPIYYSLLLKNWLSTIVAYSIGFIYISCACLNSNTNNAIRNSLKNCCTCKCLKTKEHIKLENNILYDGDLYNWLKDDNLDQYYYVFTSNGYNTVNDLIYIDGQKLNDIGIHKKRHIQFILNKIEKGKHGGTQDTRNKRYSTFEMTSQISHQS